jgi:signal transduction histidine kinase
VIAAALFHLISARSNSPESVHRPLDLLSYALLLAGPVALLFQRRAPIAVLVVASAGSVGFLTFADPRWMYTVGAMCALFLAVKAGRRAAAIAVSVAAYGVYLAVTWVFADPLGVPAGARPDLRAAVLGAVGIALAVLLGGVSKMRGEHFAAAAEARAEQNRARAEQQRRQASEERLRIARELHDVLGHHLSLINVQAGVGLHLMDNRPEQAREALTAIKTASAEALREVRAVLGVLRPDEEAAPRTPAPGLSRLADLTADAGLTVTTTTAGVRRELPPEVDRAAYRIVQEALTNVRRHAAAGTSAQVTVDYRDTELVLSIRDDGSLAAPAAVGEGGSGIAGMRARADSLGGTLHAAPSADGGFLVSAVLPTRESA